MKRKWQKLLAICFFTHDTLSMVPNTESLQRDSGQGDTIKLNYLYPEDKNIVIEKISAALKNSRGSLPKLLSKELLLPKELSTARGG